MTQYADSVSITIRVGDPLSDEGYTDVFVAKFIEVGVDADLDAAVQEVERWIVAEGLDQGYVVETRRGRLHVGADLITAGFVVTFLTWAGSNAAWDALVHYIKGLVVPNTSATDLSIRLRQLEPGEASRHLQAELANALDRRRADFEPQEIVRDEDKVEATFKAIGGDVYRIRVWPSGFRVSKVDDRRRRRRGGRG